MRQPPGRRAAVWTAACLAAPGLVWAVSFFAGSQDWYPGFLLSDFFNLGVFALWCAVLWRSETRLVGPAGWTLACATAVLVLTALTPRFPGAGWKTYLEAGLTVWIVGLGGLVLVRIASGVRRRANVRPPPGPRTPEG